MVHNYHLMAPRNVISGQQPEMCTEFQLYLPETDQVIDYTLKRLLRYIDQIVDLQQKLVVIALAHDYTHRRVAVGWRRGRPVPLRLSEETVNEAKL